MKISYKRLFKLLIDREIKKTELASQAQISSNCLAKLSKDENVSLESLIKVCTVLDVEFSEIMELVPDEK